MLNRRTIWRLLFLALALAAAGGCKSLGKRPGAENVVESRSLSLRGMEALQAGDHAQAEQLFAQAVKICPVDERARCRYAELLWRRGQYDEAVAQMNEAIRLSAGDAELLVQLGQMHLARGDAAEALAEAERAIQADPRSTAVWTLHGNALRASGHLTAALGSYHRALSLEPHLPAAQLAIADVYLKMDKPQRSLATLNALEDRYGPGQIPPEVHFHRGLALKRLGRFDDAVIALAGAIEAGATLADTYYELADAHAQAGDLANARLTVTLALRQMPEHAPSLQLQQALDAQPQPIALRSRP
jgi:tetratricopeptide (TPR) repeat protein